MMQSLNKGKTQTTKEQMLLAECIEQFANVSNPSQREFQFVASTRQALKLIAEGVDVNTKEDYTGRTPLMMAARGGRASICTALLAKKELEVNAQDDQGRTALMYAAQFGQREIIGKLSKDLRTDMNARDGSGNTAMFLAINANSTQSVSALLASGRIDINHQNRTGQGALEVAAASLSKFKDDNALYANFFEQGALLSAEGKEFGNPAVLQGFKDFVKKHSKEITLTKRELKTLKNMKSKPSKDSAAFANSMIEKVASISEARPAPIINEPELVGSSADHAQLPSYIQATSETSTTHKTPWGSSPSSAAVSSPEVPGYWSRAVRDAENQKEQNLRPGMV